ncbi:4Fe-4S binding protein [Promethearchaeum syntrophicum]|uniref:4Fe-4S binding protein n=1 Tax=Promethearchaeum syntrophicum TaxID=2594042 RepID=A0A5B9D810_9ARCH|nr:4Fe-4S binding protein [Candidatus Prometheoarchaeum syntrophicum]QEE15309.1 F(420)H(2) dehydrogenase subunit I [Candidatus Prometheoarchaeum syntrophicum]
MKWPIVEESINFSVRNTKIEYMNRTTDLMFDLNKCTSCYQCVKACPKNALFKPEIPKGKKVPRKERVPFFPDPLKCVFCGVCLTLCPFDAISMKLDGHILNRNNLPLRTGNKIPEIEKVKMKKVILVNPEFKNEFWDKIMDRIQVK